MYDFDKKPEDITNSKIFEPDFLHSTDHFVKLWQVFRRYYFFFVLYDKKWYIYQCYNKVKIIGLVCHENISKNKKEKEDGIRQKSMDFSGCRIATKR